MELIQSYLTRNPYYTRNVNKVDSRYTLFQQRGPLGGVLHSVGCAQPSALVFINNWDNPNYTNACVHGFIDANTGIIYQTMPWNYRAPHCAGSANNTHIGVEMCESKYIRYLKAGEAGYAPAKFVVLDKAKAQADCKRAYDAAVELFAMLAAKYHWNPKTDIISHNEGGKKGVASTHVDPEHYWTQLGMSYTMDSFRADVAALMNGCSIGSGTNSAFNDDQSNTQAGIKAGMLVKVASSATYYTGKAMPEWVKSTKWYVKSVTGDRAVIDKSEDGRYSIMSAVNIKYLSDASPLPISAGSLVKIADGATYYTGKVIPAWVFANRWYVKSLSGDRAVIDKSEDGKYSIMSAVNKKYLTAVQ